MSIPDAPSSIPTPATPVNGNVKRRSQTIAWGSGIFLALGVGLPLGYALHDWRAGIITGALICVFTVVGYLKAGSDHAERRADRLDDKYSREDQEDEEDDGSYN